MKAPFLQRERTQTDDASPLHNFPKEVLPDPQLLLQILQCKIIVRQRLELSFLQLGVLGLRS
ncbi:unnamed protein product [Chondrus crispus]|uniref:Uncharacterized protein n=1 Tax=Chondrus crispus TaxID=2769 RepID=R7Q2G1_CHOCR|nr:unnamed protein product [Chondrus crispus]CDF32777.1 unnamed protein product [Chondrus crispus]|eukprot:XP_005712578.1 unnamed protein product [Chondrus crispus]